MQPIPSPSTLVWRYDPRVLPDVATGQPRPHRVTKAKREDLKHIRWRLEIPYLIQRARLLDLSFQYATKIQVSTGWYSLKCLSWSYNSQVTPVCLLPMYLIWYFQTPPLYRFKIGVWMWIFSFFFCLPWIWNQKRTLNAYMTCKVMSETRVWSLGFKIKSALNQFCL